MTCTDCQAATTTQGLWSRYNTLQCQHCAARLIQALGRLPIPKEAITARRKAVLADSVAHGLDEAQIRALVVSKTMAVEPSVLSKKFSK